MEKDRNLGLDILRSIAVWNVIILHIAIILYALKITKIVWFPVPDGVDLFFVLSGYLIGKIIIKSFVEQKNTNKQVLLFWISRWLRTLPNYYFLLGILYVLIVVSTKKLFFPIYHLTFTQCMSNKIYNFYAESWSLCVEEWFYLLFPIIITIITCFNRNKFKKQHYLGIVIIIIILSPIYRYLYANSFIFKNAGNFMDYRMFTLIRFDSIAYGLLAAYLSVYFSNLWLKYYKSAFAVGFIIMFMNTLYLFLTLNGFISSSHVFITNFSFIGNGIGLLLMLPAIEKIQIKNKHLVKIFTFTSKISYSIYLLQMTFVLNICILIFKTIGMINNYTIFSFSNRLFNYSIWNSLYKL